MPTPRRYHTVEALKLARKMSRDKYRASPKGREWEKNYLTVQRKTQKVRTARWLAKDGSMEKLALAKRRSNFIAKYRLSISDYDNMLSAQNGVCRICFRVNGNGKRLAVDHDHENMRIRGLLCGKCNLALGLMGEDPNRMLRLVKYIRAAASL